MEGLREGEGLILSMYPLTSCIVLQAICMIAWSCCVCVCVCVSSVCVPTYWQLRDLNSLSFFLIFMCDSPILLSSSHFVSRFLSFLPTSLSDLLSPSSFPFLPLPLVFSFLLLPSIVFPLSDVGFALFWPKLSLPSHCFECDALSISIPLCSLHFTSSSCNLWATQAHAGAQAHMQASGATIPLALIFQQRHSVCQQPCHRLLPGDADPRSACHVLTHQHRHQQREGTQLTSEINFFCRTQHSQGPPTLPTSHPPIAYHHCRYCHLEGGAGRGEGEKKRAGRRVERKDAKARLWEGEREWK